MTATLAELAEVRDGLIRMGEAYKARHRQAVATGTPGDRAWFAFMAGDLLLRAHAISRRIRQRASCSV